MSLGAKAGTRPNESAAATATSFLRKLTELVGPHQVLNYSPRRKPSLRHGLLHFTQMVDANDGGDRQLQTPMAARMLFAWRCRAGDSRPNR
jgi:hypothetical protein